MLSPAGGLGEPEPVRPPYRTGLVIIGLAFVWVSLITGVALEPALFLFNPLLVLLAFFASMLHSVAALAFLVLSIVGRMWRRWGDGLVTLLLLLLAWFSPGLLIVSAVRQPSPLFGSPTLDSLTFRLAYVAGVLVVALGTVYWARRLVLQSGRLDGSGRRVVLVVAGASALLSVGIALALVFARPLLPPFGGGVLVVNPSFKVHLVNDTGHTVEVTYCPHQNCTGQSAATLQPDAQLTLVADSGSLPDSVVVQAEGQPTTCALLPDLGFGKGGKKIHDAKTTFSLAQEADTATCGMDVATLGH